MSQLEKRVEKQEERKPRPSTTEERQEPRKPAPREPAPPPKKGQ